MSATETWTIGKLLTWTTDYLKKHGAGSPRLDAEVLLAHARSCQRIELYTAFGEELSDEMKTAFREMVRRRAEGTPVAYLVGHKEFYSASFEVNSDVLIPRPETEHLIVEALDRAKQLRQERGDAAAPLRIADVGTGSGVVAITLAKQLKHCHVLATDTSPAALEVASRNRQRHELSAEQVELRQADVLEGSEADEALDLIVSNPPYVTAAEYAELDRSVRDFEPQAALVSGPSGWEVIDRLLEQGLPRLADDGFLLFEFSPMLAPELSAHIGPAWTLQGVTKDLAGHARIVTLRKKQG